MRALLLHRQNMSVNGNVCLMHVCCNTTVRDRVDRRSIEDLANGDLL